VTDTARIEAELEQACANQACIAHYDDKVVVK
jgi:hypothetical protein